MLPPASNLAWRADRLLPNYLHLRARSLGISTPALAAMRSLIGALILSLYESLQALKRRLGRCLGLALELGGNPNFPILRLVANGSDRANTIFDAIIDHVANQLD
jgi:hypothetical protein